MIQYLSDTNKAKADWIEQISFAFNMFRGYFVDERAGELELTFNEVYEKKLRIYIRDYPSNDLNEFINIMIKKNYNFLYETVNNIYKISNNKLKIIDYYANAGYASIDMKQKLNHSEIISITADLDELNQYKKNVISTGRIESSSLYQAISIERNSLSHVDRNRSIISINQLVQRSIHIKTFQFKLFEYENDIILTMMKQCSWDSVDVLRVGREGARRLLVSTSLSKILHATKIIVVDVSKKSALSLSIQHILKLEGFQFEVMDEITVGWK